LNTIALGLFIGAINFNKMNIITRKALGSIKKQLEADGFKEDPPGVYDMRDWEEIRRWAKELAQIAR